MTDEQYSVEAYKQRRLAQRARVAQLVFVALLAGAVGASFGYLKGEVAVLTGESQVASVILAAASSAPDAAPVPSRPAGSEVPPPSRPVTNGCPKGQEDQCRNRCSASYVRVSGSGVATYDCYGKEGDPGKKAIDALAACIKLKMGGSPSQEVLKSTNADFLKQNLCMIDAPKIVHGYDSDKPAGSELEGGKTPESGSVVIPKGCEEQYKAVRNLYDTGKEGPQSALNCSVGASVCTQTGSTASAVFANEKDSEDNKGSYTCVQKPKTGQGGNASAPAPDGQRDCSKLNGVKKEFCEFQNGVNKTIEDLKKAFGGNPNPSPAGPGSQQPQNGVTGGAGQGMPKPPAGGGSGGGSGGGAQQQPPPQCPAGYTLSSQQPQTSSSTGEVEGSDQYGRYYTPIIYQNRTYYCVPANTAQPECIFNASKNNPARGEKIKLTWQTIGTANGRVMLSDGTNEGRIEASGEQEVTITSARTYTLTAYNAQGRTKQCKVSITLGGTGEEGTAGAYPPKLSCAPSIIEKGKSATLTWECSSSAKKSAGEGTTTGGATTGKKTVTPEGNTEYTVSCFSSTDADINDEEAETFLGKRTCSVRVAEPEFDIVAYPESASRGERVRISWGSLFMKSCKVTGPRGFDYTRPNGVVVTEPFSENDTTSPDRTIRAAVYTITCESIFGKRYSADVTVDFEN